MINLFPPRENVIVIEGEYFDDMDLTDGATFLTDLIKRAKNRVNKRIIFPRDTRRRIRDIAINNGRNTQIVQILYEIHDRNFLFKGNFLSRLPTPVELTHE